MTRLIALLVLLLAAAFAKDNPLIIPAKDFDTPYGKVRVSELTLTPTDSYSYIVHGQVSNDTDRSWRSLTFNVAFFDKKGKPMGPDSESHKIYAIGVNKGKTADFKLSDMPAKVFVFVGKPARADLVFVPEDSTFDWGYKLRLVKPSVSDELVADTPSLSVQFDYDGRQLGFSMQNKLDEPIEIVWDKASFIDVAGTSHRVIHKGVKLVDRESTQANTMVAPTAKWSDIVVPSDFVEWSSVLNEWNTRPLLPSMYFVAEKLKAQKFSVFLPVVVKSKQENLLFTFEITDVPIR